MLAITREREHLADKIVLGGPLDPDTYVLAAAGTDTAISVHGRTTAPGSGGCTMTGEHSETMLSETDVLELDIHRSSTLDHVATASPPQEARPRLRHWGSSSPCC
ncbi:hypothetical protein C5142_03275 [Rhodococcus sp. BGS-1C]|uniref:hypothetical protein n=1 Tax=Mycobacteriales TaxID=85007 RepID=UPI0009614470|nr:MULTISPECIES: hypothetical protein [Mycobacteriales]MCC8930958.1 hypothetical protein [Rhodococcus sp. I2R]MCZ4278679.1 hypothetical protein [Rhodococcus yunnanensis]OLT31547.1 hypothetical protein BJF84_26835 [Rhodococcus sp. CUA-806]